MSLLEDYCFYFPHTDDIDEDLQEQIEFADGIICVRLKKETTHIVYSKTDEKTKKLTSEIPHVTPDFIHELLKKNKVITANFDPRKSGPIKRTASITKEISDQHSSNEEEKQNEEDTFDFQYQWFWQSDNGWVAFPKSVNMIIEKAFRAKKAKVNIDSERFVDFKEETQRRIDNPEKRRPLKKEKWDPSKAALGQKKRKVENNKNTNTSHPLITKTLVKKGRVPVLPASQLASTYHVLEESKDIWSCTLNQTNINNNNNKFYKIQLLEADQGSHYYVICQWGRVGASGKCTKDPFGSKIKGKEFFEKKFKSKTGNQWSQRTNFQDVYGKYHMVEEDYDDERVITTKSQLKVDIPKTKLDKRVSDFISLIGDVRQMTQALVEMKIDVGKMPLGKLSKKQIKKGYSFLKEIENELGSTHPNQMKILDATNRFYSNIPHSFGYSKPPAINSKEMVQSKIDLLDGLDNMEIAQKILKNPTANITNPIDDCYSNLKLSKLEPLDPNCDIFSKIVKSIENTHAPTHKQYKILVKDIFEVERPGEVEKFKIWKNNENRMFLWHGSRLTNWVGILSQGLRIAPPEAPVTGYMFGKGIYFADSSSKSANYCHANASNPHGVLLLCEVALGNFYRKREAEMITNLPKNFQSTFGEGKYTPDPNGNEQINGSILPCGKIIPSDISDSQLLYNEFIVYDVAQVVIRYIVRIDFKF